jgi:hypothetical protein
MSGEEIMKSADARLHAIGIFQRTAMRRSALTSGSCGWGASGSQKKILSLSVYLLVNASP